MTKCQGFFEIVYNNFGLKERHVGKSVSPKKANFAQKTLDKKVETDYNRN